MAIVRTIINPPAGAEIITSLKQGLRPYITLQALITAEASVVASQAFSCVMHEENWSKLDKKWVSLSLSLSPSYPSVPLCPSRPFSATQSCPSERNCPVQLLQCIQKHK